MTKREILINKAEEAINKVFGDTTVSQSETKNDLKELISYIEAMVDTLK